VSVILNSDTDYTNLPNGLGYETFGKAVVQMAQTLINRGQLHIIK